MYEVKVISEFSAAHKLRGYLGRCENLHGHNWVVEVCVSSKKLNRIGIGIELNKEMFEVAIKENIKKKLDENIIISEMDLL